MHSILIRLYISVFTEVTVKLALCPSRINWNTRWIEQRPYLRITASTIPWPFEIWESYQHLVLQRYKVKCRFLPIHSLLFLSFDDLYLSKQFNSAAWCFCVPAKWNCWLDLIVIPALMSSNGVKRVRVQQILFSWLSTHCAFLSIETVLFFSFTYFHFRASSILNH